MRSANSPSCKVTDKQSLLKVAGTGRVQPEKMEVASLPLHGDPGRTPEGRSQPCRLHSPCSSSARNREVNKTQNEGLPGDSSWLPLKFTKAELLMPQRLPATAPCELLHCRFSGHSVCNALGIRVIVFYLFAKSFQ